MARIRLFHEPHYDRVPLDAMVVGVPRVDVWEVLKGGKDGQRPTREADLSINGISIALDCGVFRPCRRFLDRDCRTSRRVASDQWHTQCLKQHSAEITRSRRALPSSRTEARTVAPRILVSSSPSGASAGRTLCGSPASNSNTVKKAGWNDGTEVAGNRCSVRDDVGS
jgi:hypothetical protein